MWTDLHTTSSPSSHSNMQQAKRSGEKMRTTVRNTSPSASRSTVKQSVQQMRRQPKATRKLRRLWYRPTETSQ